MGTGGGERGSHPDSVSLIKLCSGFEAFGLAWCILLLYFLHANSHSWQYCGDIQVYQARVAALFAAGVLS